MPVAVVLITPEPPAHTVNPTGCVVILVFGLILVLVFVGIAAVQVFASV